MQVQSLGQKDPLKESMATTLVFLPGESYGQRSLAASSPQGHKESYTETTQYTLSMHKFFVKATTEEQPNKDALGQDIGVWRSRISIPSLGASPSQHINLFTNQEIPLNVCEHFVFCFVCLFVFCPTVCHVGPQYLDQVSNPCPLKWKHGVSTTGPPGKSSSWSFY